MNIVVYLGANFGNKEKFIEEAKSLGAFIANSGNRLVYGGSKSGLMGVLAKSALANDGEVIGVEPKEFIAQGFEQEGITELIVCDNISERKSKMMELGDAFIAFPGGTGTLEEISEVIARVALGQKNAKCIFLNIDGFYDPMKELFSNMLKVNLSTNDKLKNVYFINSQDEIKKLL